MRAIPASSCPGRRPRRRATAPSGGRRPPAPSARSTRSKIVSSRAGASFPVLLTAGRRACRIRTLRAVRLGVGNVFVIETPARAGPRGPRSEPRVTDITAWLRRHGLERYAPRFVEEEIEPDLLPELTDADLRELGLPLGARKRMLRAIFRATASRRCSGHRSPTRTTPCAPSAGRRRSTGCAGPAPRPWRAQPTARRSAITSRRSPR